MDGPPPAFDRSQPALRQLGLIVHPTRALDGALGAIDGWARERGVTVVQVPVPGKTRRVAELGDASACDLLLALGGDGTTLTALRAGAQASRPVLGIACGSIGVLTSTAGDRVSDALDQVDAGRWTAVELPGIAVAGEGGGREVAINDVAVIRDGPGQVLVAVTVDGVLYARIAGDGLVIATALGSSAYTMAAGGPILAPGAEGMAVTALAPHGGSCPPLVAGQGSTVDVIIDSGHAGFRYEIDGHRTSIEDTRLTLSLQPGYATLVRLADEEPRLTGLRRRGLVVDSPRVSVRDARAARLANPESA